MITLRFQFWCQGDSEIELQCYSDTRVTSISMVGYIPWLNVLVRVRRFWTFMALIGLHLEIASCCDVRVSARLSLRFIIWWGWKSNDVTGLVLVPGLGLGLCAVMCTGRIELRLQSGSGSDVRMRLNLINRCLVWCGWCQCWAWSVRCRVQR